MSGGVKGRSQTPMTLLCVLGMLVLYVGTWPIIQIKAELDTARGTFFRGRTPPPSAWSITWVNRVYHPLNWLREIRVLGKVTPDDIDDLLTNPNGRNPLQWYYHWWLIRLDTSGFLRNLSPPASFPSRIPLLPPPP